MMSRPCGLALLLLVLASTASAQQPFAAPGAAFDPRVTTPRASLGYDVGERFTPHHRIVRYLEQLKATSKRIRVDTLGVTAEGREVVMAVLTSEANHTRLDSIRAAARTLADPRTATPTAISAIVARQPAIIWLGHSVHGGEASGTEASIALLYQLAAGLDAETQLILDSAVVLIDPMENPDGHERHVQDVMRARGVFGPPTDPGALIHQGSWPGARTSHYYFDLNRDWFIQSHAETRARAGALLSWWPQVAVDLHEMGTNSTYFFAPPMEPLNKNVPPNTIKWWEVFAAAIGGSFDARGWPYFRREGYDEFYPGYGVSWPTLNGAIGATFEQASSAGGAVLRDDGNVMYLRDAARHHFTAAWATSLTAARRRAELVGDFVRSRQQNVTDLAKGPMRAIVFERDGQGRGDSLAARLQGNAIEVSRLPSAVSIVGAVAYGTTTPTTLRADAGWYVIDLAQPQGRVAKALLEPDAQLDSTFIREELESRRTAQASRFYDITAWSLPMTFRVRAWTSPTVPAGLELVRALPRPVRTAMPDAAHGWAFEAGSEASYRLLAGLFRDGVKVWYAPKAFTVGDASYPRGAFIVRKAGNREGVAESIAWRVAESGAAVRPLPSALVSSGTDLGSNSVFPLRIPKIALVGGTGVNGNSFGFSWYLFDQRLAYPVTTVNASLLGSSAIDEFNVVVLPSLQGGALERELGDAGLARLQRWVRDGGVLVTLQGATTWLVTERAGLSRFRERRDTARVPGSEGAPLSTNVPGAIGRAIPDRLSPLMAGVTSDEVAVPVQGATIFAVPRDLRPGEAVLRFAPPEQVRLSGYFWPEVPARLGGSPALFTESVGQGRVIGFGFDPNFRDLWRGLLPLFANAVFFGASF